jgi:hypothetical protein
VSGDGTCKTKYEAASLEDLASGFEMFASDQRACMGRISKTQRAKRDCAIRAEVWEDAAKILRNTTILPDVNKAVKDGDGI